MERTNYSSGAPLEEKVGYSRMVKKGPFVMIGGTTAWYSRMGRCMEKHLMSRQNIFFAKFVKLLARGRRSAGRCRKVEAFLSQI